MSERRLSHQDRVEIAKWENGAQFMVAIGATVLSALAAYEAYQDGFKDGDAVGAAVVVAATLYSWEEARRGILRTRNIENSPNTRDEYYRMY